MSEKISLEERILDDYKKAYKKGRKYEVSCLRMLRSEIKNKEIQKRAKLDDEEIVKLLISMLKKENESLAFFVKGNRQQLAQQTKEEIKLIKKYLPKNLSHQEINKIVKDVLDDNNLKALKDIGPAMKFVMKKIQGRADGKLVNQIVKEKLTKNE